MLSVFSTGGCRNIGHQHAKEHGSLLVVKADMLAYRDCRNHGGSGSNNGGLGVRNRRICRSLCSVCSSSYHVS